ncbi:hypothetical protein CKO36_18230 [Rhabdochromatium marinum]|nr:hypothetical protein [Rhabdochromatium marinum]
MVKSRTRLALPVQANACYQQGNQARALARPKEARLAYLQALAHKCAVANCVTGPGWRACCKRLLRPCGLAKLLLDEVEASK